MNGRIPVIHYEQKYKSTNFYNLCLQFVKFDFIGFLSCKNLFFSQAINCKDFTLLTVNSLHISPILCTPQLDSYPPCKVV